MGLPGGSAVENLPAMQETQVQSPSREDSQEKEMATHSGILAWEIPRTEEPEVLQCMGSHGIRHGRATGHWAQFSHLSII